MKQAVWDKFCARFNVAESCVPLFATDPDGNVQHKPIGTDQRLILKRSEECDAMILSVTDPLVEDWKAGAHLLDGMLYMMGWKQAGKFMPLYVGKAETLGRREGNLSANIKDLLKNRRNFARWGDNYAYHVGDLSACVLPGHAEIRKKPKYQSWAECLFIEGTTKLRKPVYFWATAWNPSRVGVWDEFGPTSLAFFGVPTDRGRRRNFTQPTQS